MFNFLYVLFQAMLKLARMYLTVDDLDACQQQCVQLLKMDAENDDATVVSLGSRFLQLTSFVRYVLRVECLMNCFKATLLRIVQNSAARLVTLTRKQEHITPILIGLHWLPVRFRIIFKILLLTYKALNGLALSYEIQVLVPCVKIFRQPIA